MHTIKLHYFKEVPNFGDELSVFIAHKQHRSVKHASRTRCNAVFAGSLMNNFMTSANTLIRSIFLLCPTVYVWGAGFIEAPDLNEKKLLRRLDVRACRGFLTLEVLKQMPEARITDATVVADPGLLAGRLINTSGTVKKHALGVVPHYVDKEDPLLSNISVANSTVIDIQQPPEAFMGKLAECENVISSSLHGLIAADSLGIPNVRMVVSDRIGGGDFKFNDYYSAYGFDSHVTIDLTRRNFSDADLPDIRDMYAIKPEQASELQDALLAAFPFV